MVSEAHKLWNQRFEKLDKFLKERDLQVMHDEDVKRMLNFKDIPDGTDQIY